MAGEDERLADTPWWKEGGADDLDESIMYPPELLGTSWGSYLASLPPTAGRKVVLAGKDERTATRNGDKHGTSPLRGSPRRSTLRNKDSSTPAEPVAGTRRSQPHPHSLQRLSTALQRALDSLVSCGIDASPLSRASATVNKFRTQKGGSIGVVVTSATEMTVEETVLEALACQAKIMEEHAMSLKHTAAVLTRNQEQFTRDQLEMQQTIEAAFSQIVTQQKLLEERKDAFIKEDTLYHHKQKPYTVGLREGQHRLALMQTRKEHSRLEKALLQQQRDLRRLEEAYKTELAAEQYNSKQKIPKSEISRPSHRRVFGLQDKFHKHNKELQKLVDQLEASRRGLAETGSRLRASEREAQVPVTSHSPAVGSSLHLPCISTANSTLRNQKKAASSTHISLPLINTHGPHKPRPRGQDKKRGNLSCSELMELAHFRSPKVAREVMNWLEKEGAISDK